MYGVTKSGKLFADEFIEWLLESVFIQSQCQISIYYKYALYGSKIVVLSHVDDCVYWYANEDIRKYAKDFGRVLRFLKSLYGMPNYVKLFSDELTEWLLEADFIQS